MESCMLIYASCLQERTGQSNKGKEICKNLKKVLDKWKVLR